MRKAGYSEGWAPHGVRAAGSEAFEGVTLQRLGSICALSPSLYFKILNMIFMEGKETYLFKGVLVQTLAPELIN